jgi:hypothetical protein
MSELQHDNPISTKPSFLKRWLGWRTLALTILLMILLAPVSYRAWRLSQVPVSNEPFDLKQFLQKIPASENSYDDFRRAEEQLKPNPSLALKTWFEATEKDRFQPPAKWTDSESPDVAVSTTQEFIRLSSDQISKSIRVERPADSIPWIRAQLRFAHLIRQKGLKLNYSTGVAYFSVAAKNANFWSSRPELNRQALDRVRADLKSARDLSPPLSEMIKAECVSEISLYKRWSVELEQSVHATIDQHVQGRIAVPEPELDFGWRAWLEAEPEYTIRLFPHIARNHLLLIEEDRRDRPELINEDLFEDTSATPAQRGDLRAERLAALIQGAYVWRSSRLKGTLNLIDRDEARYRCLIVSLAAQAYFRDHGEFPADANELVPGYLDELPDDLYSPTPAPLIYRRDGHGAVVYSRFENEIDDGGSVVDYDERIANEDLPDFGFRIRNPFDRPLSAPKPPRD